VEPPLVCEKKHSLRMITVETEAHWTFKHSLMLPRGVLKIL